MKDIKIWKLIVPFIIVYSLSIGCSVLVLHKSNANTIKDTTEPKTVMPIEVMGKGNSMKVVKDSLN